MQTHIRHLNRHQCKGFSLVEAAIVLGVIGLVIGGIWVAVNAVRENHKINETVIGMLNAANTLKQLVTPATASPDGNGWTDLNNLCVKTEAFKGFPITSNYKIQNPFGAVAGALYGIYAGAGSRCAM